MKNYFLIKRDPDFSKHGVIVKRNQKHKGFMERIVSKSNRPPRSAELGIKEGDVVYVAQTKGGDIYAYGEVTEVGHIHNFDTPNEALTYIDSHKEHTNLWLFESIVKLNHRKNEDSKYSLKIHPYFIDQKLLKRTIPIEGILKEKYGGNKADAFFAMDSESVDYLENPIYEFDTELDPKIPENLRLNIYSLVNKHYGVEYTIDIDHFVPKSVGGPGNIMENLVPVGMSINRHKNNAIPKGIFIVANQVPPLREFVPNKYLSSDTSDFIREHDAKEGAREINNYIKTNFSTKEAKNFYKSVINVHLPEYVKALEEFYE